MIITWAAVIKIEYYVFLRTQQDQIVIHNLVIAVIELLNIVTNYYVRYYSDINANFKMKNN